MAIQDQRILFLFLVSPGSLFFAPGGPSDPFLLQEGPPKGPPGATKRANHDLEGLGKNSLILNGLLDTVVREASRVELEGAARPPLSFQAAPAAKGKRTVVFPVAIRTPADVHA